MPPLPFAARFSSFPRSSGVFAQRCVDLSLMLTSPMQSCTVAVYSYFFPVHISFFTLTSYEEMPVIDWACTFLSKFAGGRQRIQIQDLERMDQADANWKLLKTFLKGVRVTVSVPAGRRPARPIKDLERNVGNYRFMKGDDETTIRVRSVFVMPLISDRPCTFRSTTKKSTATGFGTQDYSAYASTSNKRPSFPPKYAPSWAGRCSRRCSCQK